MSEIEIRSDRPLPKGRVQRGWDRLKVGDTIVLDKNRAGQANQWALRAGKKRRFVGEKIEDPKDPDFGKYLIGRIE